MGRGQRLPSCHGDRVPGCKVQPMRESQPLVEAASGTRERLVLGWGVDKEGLVMLGCGSLRGVRS